MAKPKIRERKDVVRHFNEMLEAGLVTFVNGRAEVVKETLPSLSKPAQKLLKVVSTGHHLSIPTDMGARLALDLSFTEIKAARQELIQKGVCVKGKGPIWNRVWRLTDIGRYYQNLYRTNKP